MKTMKFVNNHRIILKFVLQTVLNKMTWSFFFKQGGLLESAIVLTFVFSISSDVISHTSVLVLSQDAGLLKTLQHQ